VYFFLAGDLTGSCRSGDSELTISKPFLINSAYTPQRMVVKYQCGELLCWVADPTLIEEYYYRTASEAASRFAST
jgi:hypothetical protein